MVFNHWVGDKDQIFFVKISIRQNNLEPIKFVDKEFRSPLDRNLVKQFSLNSAMAGVSKFTISKKLINMLRSQRRFFVHF